MTERCAPCACCWVGIEQTNAAACPDAIATKSISRLVIMQVTDSVEASGAALATCDSNGGNVGVAYAMGLAQSRQQQRCQQKAAGQSAVCLARLPTSPISGNRCLGKASSQRQALPSLIMAMQCHMRPGSRRPSSRCTEEWLMHPCCCLMHSQHDFAVHVPPVHIKRCRCA